jgi:hypothetical protein
MGIEPLREVIYKLGEKLGFEVEREVPVSTSAWVNSIWCIFRGHMIWVVFSVVQGMPIFQIS